MFIAGNAPEFRLLQQERNVLPRWLPTFTSGFSSAIPGAINLTHLRERRTFLRIWCYNMTLLTERRTFLRIGAINIFAPSERSHYLDWSSETIERAAEYP